MSDPAAAPLRMGVVGCGAVTELYHLRALLASTEVDVVAFVDPDEDRARALAARVPGAAALSRQEDLAGQVDAVLLATPNALHASLGVPLLSGGTHVLVEKPMARTVAECDQLLAAAAEGGAVLGRRSRLPALPRRAGRSPAVRRRADGEVRRVDVRQSAGGRWPYASPAALSREAGGGVLLDFGGAPAGPAAVVARRPAGRRLGRRPAGLETECQLDLTLANGAPGVARAQPQPRPARHRRGRAA